MAFDCTYLQSGLNQMELHGKHLLVGGCFTPSHPGNAVLELTPELDVRKAKKSEQMLTFLAWDPSAYQKIPLPMAEIPVEQNFKGPMSSMRASYYMLELVGRVLQASDGAVKAVVFDAAAAHGLLRRVMFGTDAACTDNSLQEIPFFRELSYRSLPTTLLPRMPIKLALYQNEAMWALPGVCALIYFYFIYLYTSLYISMLSLSLSLSILIFIYLYISLSYIYLYTLIYLYGSFWVIT